MLNLSWGRLTGVMLSGEQEMILISWGRQRKALPERV